MELEWSGGGGFRLELKSRKRREEEEVICPGKGSRVSTHDMLSSRPTVTKHGTLLDLPLLPCLLLRLHGHRLLLPPVRAIRLLRR